MSDSDDGNNRLLGSNHSDAPKAWRLSEVPFIKKHGWIPCCCCVLLGILLAILSLQLLFLPNLIEQILHSGIKSSIIFTYPHPDSAAYQGWVGNNGSNGAPIWDEIRFFNITNTDDILRYGSIPQLVLSKPIVYNQIEIKTNISFSDDGEWAEYRTWTYYTYNKDKSILKETDYFVILSPIVASIYHAYEQGDIIDKLILKEILKYLRENPDKLFWTGTAHDLLFNLKNITVPDPLNPDKPFVKEFSGLLGNATIKEAVQEITHTGYNDLSRMGEVLEYKNSKWIECWNPALTLSPGHDNFFGVLSLTKDDIVYAWVNDLQVSLYAIFNKTVDLYNTGLETYKFTIQITPQFDNATQYPPNGQYYLYGPSGVLNLTKCSSDVSLFASLPLFLGSDDYQKNNSKLGLSLLDWDDQPYFNIEPLTGAILNANKSLQINTQIQPIADDLLNDVLEDSTRRMITNDNNDIVTVELTNNINDVSAATNATTATPTTATPTTATPTTATPTTATPTTATPTTATPTTATPTTAIPTTTTPTTAVPTTGTPTTATPTTATPTTATPTTGTPTTATPTTATPTSGPTIPPKSLAHLPQMMIPMLEISECGGLTKSQASDFANEINSAKNMKKASEIIGYIATPLFIIYIWWVFYWIGKKRGMKA